METEHHVWHSPNTGKKMTMLQYGVAGLPILYLPTSGGGASEFEEYGFPKTCGPWIEAERIRVFAIDAGGPTGFWNDGLTPAERIRTYAAFERYAGEEVIPRICELTGASGIGIAGASYGAFMGANLLLKGPGRIRFVCGLGGVYGLWHRLDGYHDDEVYFHTPLEYLPRLEDAAMLSRIRATDGFYLYAAEDDEWLDSTRRFAKQLRARELPHRVRVWRAPANHHERWWRDQLAHLLGTILPAI
jgi:esterase/lipase superfamily enzyme